MEGSYMLGFTISVAIFLVWVVMHEAISACRFLKIEGSYMLGFTVSVAIFLVWVVMNEAISACRFLYAGFSVGESYSQKLSVCLPM